MKYILIASLSESGGTVYYGGNDQWTHDRTRAERMGRLGADAARIRLTNAMGGIVVYDIAVIAE